jgi:catechol 2,3-dioxygenase-like lactoylglutathione lyase family enzyme
MAIVTGGLHHLGIRVTDLARARAFYVDILGFQPVLEQPGLVIVNAYGLLMGIRADSFGAKPDDHFDPSRVGLDHLALAVPDPKELVGLKTYLDQHGVSNNGIESDTLLGATYISFYDPDGIAWELYAMPLRG